ncbi:MAG: SDR family NAD(P)-dependent oxidoreductase [Pseudolabrys sp.]
MWWRSRRGAKPNCRPWPTRSPRRAIPARTFRRRSRRPDGTARLAEALQAAQLEPSIVVNNAGFGLLGDATDLDQMRQLAMIDLNVRVLTDLSLRWLSPVARHRGGILNVASVASFFPGPGMAVYHATKAYVLSFTESLHEELKAEGVRACALCPGPVETEFFRACRHAGRLRSHHVPPLGRAGGARRLRGLHGRPPRGGARHAEPYFDPGTAASAARLDAETVRK